MASLRWGCARDESTETFGTSPSGDVYQPNPPAPPKPAHAASWGPAQAPIKETGTAGEYGKTPLQGVRPYSASTYVGTHSGSTGRCPFNLCLYWDSNEGGAAAGFTYNVPDLVGYIWPNNGPGAGSRIKNNAASIENQHFNRDFSFYNENYSAQFDYLDAITFGTLVQSWNNEASIATS